MIECVNFISSNDIGIFFNKRSDFPVEFIIHVFNMNFKRMHYCFIIFDIPFIELLHILNNYFNDFQDDSDDSDDLVDLDDSYY